MRILLVNASARSHTGGVHRMVVESCDWIQRAGHTVALAYYDGGPSHVPCPTFPLARSSADSGLRRGMEKVLADFQPDAVQLHLAEPEFFLEQIGETVPTARFIHDQAWFCSGGDRMARGFAPCHRPHGWSCLLWHYAQGCGGKSPVGNWRRWRQVQPLGSLKHSRVRVQVASEFMRRGLRENDYPADKIDVIPLFAVPGRTDAASEPGLLLVASRLVKGKGVDFLLDALRHLPALDWQLAVAGGGPQRAALETFCQTHGLDRRVKFLGELSPQELEPWYARASVIVSPVLRREPFGLVGLEAMAHGKPMVAFEGGATNEWLVDGETGLLVSERTTAALADALTRLLEQPAEARRLGEGASHRWENYRPEIYVTRLVASLERCVADFRRGRA